ncbi:MAG: hypothetical protein HN700_06780, partial [Verrucomicrobia bacterium]|nr:hypothetical protein [Verrucomicrobiota bacterium]
MQQVNLDGKWTVRQEGGDLSLPARVPGDVISDLLKAKQIPDPFYRENERDVQWVGEADWTYERQFKVSAALMRGERVVLQCDGLDTFATVTVNGKRIATTDNMFRSFEWDVKSYLQVGTNTIQITFKSVNDYTRKVVRERALHSQVGGGHPTAHPCFVRKEQCNFGWDWGIILVTCGIWRSIRLASISTGRLADLRIDQEHVGGKVSLGVEVGVEATTRKALTVRTTLRLKGKVVAQQETASRGRNTRVALQVSDPQLWWPNGMGDQPLYDLQVELLDGAGARLDGQTKRIGFRTLRLDRHADEWGESFQFVVNGVPFFAKGANWIPADAVLARRSPEMYRSLIEDSAAVNMNMLRVWGGGIYEDDVFYDICDELGICVWQDFMFACMAYPSWKEPFMKTVEAEARDNLRRLRHHPCIALWCGNNELEQQSVVKGGSERNMSWEEYALLFDDLLADVSRELAPQT